MKKNKTSPSTWSNVRFIVSCCWKYDKKLFAYFIFATIAKTIIPFIGIFLPKLLIDELMGSKSMVNILLYLLGFLLIGCVANYASSFFSMAKLPHAVNVRMQNMLRASEKCMDIDFKETENPKTLDDMQTAMRATNDNNSGLEGMIHTLFNMVGNVLAFIGYITIVFTLNPLILIFLILNVLISFYFTSKVKKYEHSRKDDISLSDRKCWYMTSTMSDFSYGKDIRIFNLAKNLCKRFKTITNENVSISKQICNRYFLTDLLDVFLLLLQGIIVYGYLIYKVLTGTMTIGNFTMYFSSVNGFADWMHTVMSDLANLNAQSLSVSDFRNFLDLKTQDDVSENHIAIPKTEGYTIELKNVSFKYPNSDVYIFRNLSLTIKQGEKLALVGINGAGKTTLIKLITKLYEPNSGEILLNGINIKRFKQKEYYQLYATVFQDINIFPFSAIENVAVSVDIDNTRAIDAMQKAGIYEKINNLPNGLDTSLKKIVDVGGVELSGGENQKVSLARALYKESEIIILDEPTSALDPIAEYEIYQHFNNLIGSKIAVYISHRLASTRFCDSIAFLENGEILEYGSHTELLNLKGKYYEMFQIQSQYYKEDNIAEEGVTDYEKC